MQVTTLKAEYIFLYEGTNPAIVSCFLVVISSCLSITNHYWGCFLDGGGLATKRTKPSNHPLKRKINIRWNQESVTTWFKVASWTQIFFRIITPPFFILSFACPNCCPAPYRFSAEENYGRPMVGKILGGLIFANPKDALPHHFPRDSNLDKRHDILKTKCKTRTPPNS